MLLPQINLSSVTELYRPERVAQVIMTTEAYGTPVMDRFYPEGRRSAWDQILVPRSIISKITRAVPVVLRGAPGISIARDTETFEYFVAQPVKTFDAISAAEFNNAALSGRVSLEQWSSMRIMNHLATHRNSAEGLAAQSLTGTITWPVASPTGAIIDTYTVAFGTNATFVVSADWTAAGTTIETIYQDLLAMRRQQRRVGYNINAVLAGVNVMAALLKKVQGLPNDTRTVARQQEDGGIRIVDFVIYPFDAEYFHPGGVGGSPAAGYKKVVADDNILAYDTAAPFTFLRVKLDNFKLPANPAPLGMIAEITKDGGAIELFGESKPFPIPVPQATLVTDVTVT